MDGWRATVSATTIYCSQKHIRTSHLTLIRLGICHPTLTIGLCDTNFWVYAKSHHIYSTVHHIIGKLIRSIYLFIYSVTNVWVVRWHTKWLFITVMIYDSFPSLSTPICFISLREICTHIWLRNCNFCTHFDMILK